MISVKAIKQSAQTEQQSRDDFAEKDNQKRKLIPAFFLLFVTGCTIYLKSFLPTRIEAHDSSKDAQADKHDGEEASEEEDLTGALASEEEPDDAQSKRGSSENVAPTRIMLAPDGENAPGGSSSLPGSDGRERPPAVTIQANPFGDAGLSRNDNRAASQGGAPSAGGGGAGGGGGGGSGGGGHDDGNGHGGPRQADPPGVPPRETNPDPHRNRAPRIAGPVYLRDMVGCQAFMISVLTLLAGASDADGDNLQIVGLSANSGTLTQADDGGWSFTHEVGLLGEVKLSYFITDGAVPVPQVAYFNVVVAPPIVGTDGDDNLLGTQCADAIDGRDGNDNIDAREGNDVIVGGAGDDHIVAGAGNDIVYAGAGNDVVYAGLGDDIVFGGAGNDRLFGEDGDDILLGEDGDDLLAGGAGNDTIDGGDGDDVLAGGDGADIVLAGAGADFVDGGNGNDTLLDGSGRDSVSGGDGNDIVIAAADGDADIYDGGIGADTLDYSASQANITIDIAQGSAQGLDIGNDHISGFERLVSGGGDDSITMSSAAMSVSGGDGNDVIADGVGADTVNGDGGDDRIVAAAGAADDIYDGGGGQDTLSYSKATLSVTIDLRGGTVDGQDVGHDLIANFEQIIGGNAGDRLIAGDSSISMTGGGGRDTFEFQRGAGEHPELLVRKITDFTVGDRIVAATYEIGYLREDGAEDIFSDLFEDIYLTSDDNHRPVRFHFEMLGQDEFTVVDVHDRPDSDGFFSIEVAGHHQLQFTLTIGTGTQGVLA